MSSTLQIKSLLASLGISQRQLAEHAEVSPATITAIVAHGKWPTSIPKSALRFTMEALLREHGATDEDLARAWRPVAKETTKNTKPKAAAASAGDQEDIMLMRKQGLSPAAKNHFNLARDPFLNDMRGSDDVYLSSHLRQVREALHSTARFGGFMALTGESGSGKSTLREELEDWVAKNAPQVMLIQPFVLGMESNDKTGKTMTASHIAESIVSTVNPGAKKLSSPEARFRQVDQELRNSVRGGRTHCLIIEEAHCLSRPTLKHLKRFHELKEGFQSLLAIILIGQQELLTTLSSSNHEVREVVQRCEVVQLRELNGDLEAYIKFKLSRAGGDPSKIITEAGIEALRNRLAGPTSANGKRGVSLCYPLAVANMMSAAMNVAVEIGKPVVDADVIAEV